MAEVQLLSENSAISDSPPICLVQIGGKKPLDIIEVPRLHPCTAPTICLSEIDDHGVDAPSPELRRSPSGSPITNLDTSSVDVVNTSSTTESENTAPDSQSVQINLTQADPTIPVGALTLADANPSEPDVSSAKDAGQSVVVAAAQKEEEEDDDLEEGPLTVDLSKDDETNTDGGVESGPVAEPISCGEPISFTTAASTAVPITVKPQTCVPKTRSSTPSVIDVERLKPKHIEQRSVAAGVSHSRSIAPTTTKPSKRPNVALLSKDMKPTPIAFPTSMSTGATNSPPNTSTASNASTHPNTFVASTVPDILPRPPPTAVVSATSQLPQPVPSSQSTNPPTVPLLPFMAATATTPLPAAQLPLMGGPGLGLPLSGGPTGNPTGPFQLVNINPMPQFLGTPGIVLHGTVPPNFHAPPSNPLLPTLPAAANLNSGPAMNFLQPTHQAFATPLFQTPGLGGADFILDQNFGLNPSLGPTNTSLALFNPGTMNSNRSSTFDSPFSTHHLTSIYHPNLIPQHSANPQPPPLLFPPYRPTLSGTTNLVSATAPQMSTSLGGSVGGFGGLASGPSSSSVSSTAASDCTGITAQNTLLPSNFLSGASPLLSCGQFPSCSIPLPGSSDAYHHLTFSAVAPWGTSSTSCISASASIAAPGILQPAPLSSHTITCSGTSTSLIHSTNTDSLPQPPVLQPSPAVCKFIPIAPVSLSPKPKSPTTSRTASTTMGILGPNSASVLPLRRRRPLLPPRTKPTTNIGLVGGIPRCAANIDSCVTLPGDSATDLTSSNRIPCLESITKCSTYTTFSSCVDDRMTPMLTADASEPHTSSSSDGCPMDFEVDIVGTDQPITSNISPPIDSPYPLHGSPPPLVTSSSSIRQLSPNTTDQNTSPSSVSSPAASSSSNSPANHCHPIPYPQRLSSPNTQQHTPHVGAGTRLADDSNLHNSLECIGVSSASASKSSITSSPLEATGLLPVYPHRSRSTNRIRTPTSASPVSVEIDFPQILTHFIDGHVIYESKKPFPVKNGMAVVEAALLQQYMKKEKPQSNGFPTAALVNGTKGEPMQLDAFDSDQEMGKTAHKQTPPSARSSNLTSPTASDSSYIRESSDNEPNGHQIPLTSTASKCDEIKTNSSPTLPSHPPSGRSRTPSEVGDTSSVAPHDRSVFSRLPSSVQRNHIPGTFASLPNHPVPPLLPPLSLYNTVITTHSNLSHPIHDANFRTAAAAPPSNLPPPPPPGPVRKWSPDEVVLFVQGTSGCAAYANAFLTNEIDGEALLLLTQDQLMQPPIGMKFGPALKLTKRLEGIK